MHGYMVCDLKFTFSLEFFIHCQFLSYFSSVTFTFTILLVYCSSNSVAFSFISSPISMFSNSCCDIVIRRHCGRRKCVQRGCTIEEWVPVKHELSNSTQLPAPPRTQVQLQCRILQTGPLTPRLDPIHCWAVRTEVLSV